MSKDGFGRKLARKEILHTKIQMIDQTIFRNNIILYYGIKFL